MHPNALKQYKQVDLSASVQTASPHQLVSMMFAGGLEALAKSRGAIERNNIEQRTAQINKATEIIVNLRGILDLEKGGELAANLDALYAYMLQQLMRANRQNSAPLLEEVSQLLGGISSSWTEIPPSEHDKTAS